MWTVLVILCLVSSFDLHAATRSLHEESPLARFDSTLSGFRNVEDVPVRLPRRFRGNSRTRRLHIENQHGFDGKVEKIHINSEEDLPGVHARQVQNKNLVVNNVDHVEKTTKMDNAEDVSVNVARAARSPTDHRSATKRLEPDNRLESGYFSTFPSEHPANLKSRATRSIETEPGQDDRADLDLEDLEAQDAKVFRPLFTYRRQMSKRRHRVRNHIHRFPIAQKSNTGRKIIPVF